MKPHSGDTKVNNVKMGVSFSHKSLCRRRGNYFDPGGVKYWGGVVVSEEPRKARQELVDLDNGYVGQRPEHGL